MYHMHMLLVGFTTEHHRLFTISLVCFDTTQANQNYNTLQVNYITKYTQQINWKLTNCNTYVQVLLPESQNCRAFKN